MNLQSCEREAEVVRAILEQQPSSELLKHAEHCTVCSEALFVAGALAEDASLSQHELSNLPDPSQIWRKAQISAREKALARATRPIRLVKTMAYVGAAFALPAALAFSPAKSMFSALFARSLFSMDTVWPTAFPGTALLVGITGTIFCVGVSSWYLLREE